MKEDKNALLVYLFISLKCKLWKKTRVLCWSIFLLVYVSSIFSIQLRPELVPVAANGVLWVDGVVHILCLAVGQVDGLAAHAPHHHHHQHQQHHPLHHTFWNKYYTHFVMIDFKWLFDEFNIFYIRNLVFTVHWSINSKLVLQICNPKSCFAIQKCSY